MTKTVAIVPCRKYSKRLPNKNKLPLCGKTIVQWAVELALKLDFVDEVIVATDDEDIKDMVIDEYVGERVRIYNDYKAGENGRPTKDIVRDCLEGYPIDTTVIWLQPTTPLRTAYQVSHAYKIYKERASFPLISAYIDEKNKTFQHNGGIYIFTLAWALFCKNIVSGEFMCVYFMSKEDSIDIDTIENFHLAEKRMEERLRNE